MSSISIVVILMLTLAICSSATAAERIVGADISMLPEIEKAGGTFTDDAKPGDAVKIFRAHGWNLFRLRLFVNPTTDFNKSWGATQDLKTILALSKRIKAAGGHILLNFHYSDTWADPLHQHKPAAWKDLPIDALVKQVHDYTAEVLRAMEQNGTPPEMVQIGNEIAGGMLWPDGKLFDVPKDQEQKQWDQLAAMLKAGIDGARQVQPNRDAMRIMIHIHGGGQKDVPTWFFGRLAKYKLDYDLIGVSFYPVSGESIDLLKLNIKQLIDTHGKDVVVAEVSYPWKPVDYADKHKDTTPWPMTPAGQEKFITDLDAMLQSMPNSHGLGFIWWYPEAIPTKGLSIWRGGAEALFDDKGNALPAMRQFKAR
ncbi:MAG: glycosyl hydrolase 53 family protein [Burkholderiales bacterium]|nr:glycosyl hydrolase 53 family protein [Phycisphaerae bacterium]